MNYTDWCTDIGISIHAAREGGDRVDVQLFAGCTHFNPRRP